MKNKKLIEISTYIDGIKKNAFNDITHIQNNVLNKNPNTSKFISHYFFDAKWLVIPWVAIALVGTAAAFVVGFKKCIWSSNS